MGITEEQLADLPRYRRSAAFSARERLVLDLATALVGAPVGPPPALLAALRQEFDEAQLVELAAALAWENYRARFNRVFGVRSGGFTEATFCVLPERPTGPTRGDDQPKYCPAGATDCQ